MSVCSVNLSGVYEAQTDDNSQNGPATNFETKSVEYIHDMVYNITVLEGYLTTKQASQMFGLSDAHIRRLLEHGTVVAIKVGHIWLVHATAMEAYMANRPKPGRKPRREPL